MAYDEQSQIESSQKIIDNARPFNILNSSPEFMLWKNDVVIKKLSDLIKSVMSANPFNDDDLNRIKKDIISYQQIMDITIDVFDNKERMELDARNRLKQFKNAV